MDIRGKDNCRVILWLAQAAMILIGAGTFAFAGDENAELLLAGTYRLADPVARSQTQNAVVQLDGLLSQCKDEYLAFRIRYRAAVLCFKGGMSDAAKERFEQVGQMKGCPELIRVCTMNMLGQLCRLYGENEKALEAFEGVVEILDKKLSSEDGSGRDPGLEVVLCTALFSRGEIYELRGDRAGAASQYIRLAEVLKELSDDALSRRYGARLNDRLGRLYLQLGDVDRYQQSVRNLVNVYPHYYRTPIVAFDSVCVDFLKTVSCDGRVARCDLEAPARVIAYLKEPPDAVSVRQVVDRLAELCQKYGDSFGGIVLQYHYAWFLDTLGEKEHAAQIFARICSRDSVKPEDFGQKKIFETVKAYGGIQSAIMSVESGDYTKAMDVSEHVVKVDNSPHVSELLESVRNSIETLNIEAVKDEKRPK